VNNKARTMTKAEAMDKLMDACDKAGSNDVLDAIRQAFQLDLESVQGLPARPREALDAYLNSAGGITTGASIRALINEAFGINLDALSALAGGKISIFSKNQWMLQDEEDLFAVLTGIGDIDVRIVPTDYYARQTGSAELPADLVRALSLLGYSHEASIGGCYYADPDGKPVADAFKGQTMNAIRTVIQQSYARF